ncbi:allophanate hydrolase [Ectothiorhodospiraceae bacterium 2226]|nr:allophanate hydrolase [Ectothiorhodospiraceae bacterium 2226]
MPDMTLSTLKAAYRAGVATPAEVVARAAAAARADTRNGWITVLSDAQLRPYIERLTAADPSRLPLYGIPFAIKDNIDLAGVPTTAGCPDYAYTPSESAFVVQRLLDAGAVPIGKTNLDQFATGLVGTRSPYGPGRNAFDPDYIAGGSSAGSATAVALGQVSFSLGTDTAGSGRVPAAFNNLVGLKPSKGLLSTRGVVPACRSLDCVSIFALNGADAQAVLRVAQCYDPADAYARPVQAPRRGRGAFAEAGFRFGVPRAAQLSFFGNADAEALYRQSVERLQSLGGERVELDFEPFLAAARLLYEGPWVAERYHAIKDVIETRPEILHPVTRAIIAGAAEFSAVDGFDGLYRLEALRRAAEASWQQVDVVVTPTAGTIYRLDEVAAEPMRLNSNLGYYTNFMNLLDLAAIAVPAGFQSDGLPFGVTLFAPAFYDDDLLQLGDRLHRSAGLALGAGDAAHPAQAPAPPSGRGRVQVAVCGAHMEGLPLNHQLSERGARLLCRTRTAPAYRLYALPGGPPLRPGLVRAGHGGEAVEVEVWELAVEHFGSFVAAIPAPLGIGKIELGDGSWVPGFICEAYAAEGAEEITALGSWRTFLDKGACLPPQATATASRS